MSSEISRRIKELKEKNRLKKLEEEHILFESRLVNECERIGGIRFIEDIPDEELISSEYILKYITRYDVTPTTTIHAYASVAEKKQWLNQFLTGITGFIYMSFGPEFYAWNKFELIDQKTGSIVDLWTALNQLDFILLSINTKEIHGVLDSEDGYYAIKITTDLISNV